MQMPIRNRNLTLPKAALIGVGLLVSTLSATLILTPAAAFALKRAYSTSEKHFLQILPSYKQWEDLSISNNYRVTTGSRT